MHRMGNLNQQHTSNSRKRPDVSGECTSASFSSNANFLSCGNGATATACSTKVDPIHLSQNWTIENFAPLVKLCKPGHCLRSHVFRHPSLPEATWQLCLYPAGKRAENSGFVSLFLKMSSASPSREILVTAEYKFFFLDDNKQSKFTNVNVGDFHAKPPKCGHSWGLRNIPRSRVMSSLSSEGALLVHCEIEFLPDPCRLRSQVLRPVSIFGENRNYFVLAPVAKSFIENSLRALDVNAGGLFHDCTISVPRRCHCDGASSSTTPQSVSASTAADSRVRQVDDENDEKYDESLTSAAAHSKICRIPSNFNVDESSDVVQFKAHKFMLAAHSVVFKAMFEHSDTLESRQNCIFIADFEPNVVAAMLRFLYSCGTEFTVAGADGDLGTDDELATSVQSATDLLALAEKYSISHLKLQCEDFLSCRLTRDNACQMLAMADMHRADQLKKICLNFFASNRRDLLHMRDWSEMKNSRPKLTNEMLEFLLQQQNGGGDCLDDFSQSAAQKKLKIDHSVTLRRQQIYRMSLPD